MKIKWMMIIGLLLLLTGCGGKSFFPYTTETEISIFLNDSIDIPVSLIVDLDNPDVKLKWKSVVPSYNTAMLEVSIDQDNQVVKVKGLAEGIDTLVLKVDDYDKRIELKVNIISGVKEIVGFKTAESNLGDVANLDNLKLGHIYDVRFTTRPVDYDNDMIEFELDSSARDIIRVTEDNEIEVIGIGSGSITVKTKNGVSEQSFDFSTIFNDVLLGSYILNNANLKTTSATHFDLSTIHELRDQTGGDVIPWDSFSSLLDLNGLKNLESIHIGKSQEVKLFLSGLKVETITINGSSINQIVFKDMTALKTVVLNSNEKLNDVTMSKLDILESVSITGASGFLTNTMVLIEQNPGLNNVEIATKIDTLILDDLASLKQFTAMDMNQLFIRNLTNLETLSISDNALDKLELTNLPQLDLNTNSNIENSFYDRLSIDSVGSGLSNSLLNATTTLSKSVVIKNTNITNLVVEDDVIYGQLVIENPLLDSLTLENIDSLNRVYVHTKLKSLTMNHLNDLDSLIIDHVPEKGEFVDDFNSSVDKLVVNGGIKLHLNNAELILDNTRYQKLYNLVNDKIIELVLFEHFTINTVNYRDFDGFIYNTLDELYNQVVITKLDGISTANMDIGSSSKRLIYVTSKVFLDPTVMSFGHQYKELVFIGNNPSVNHITNGGLSFNNPNTMKVTMMNIRIEANPKLSALSSNHSINLDIYGLVSLSTKTSESATIIPFETINVDDLSITSNPGSNFVVIGAIGKTSRTPTQGGVALSASQLSIKGSGSISISGGDGGSGMTNDTHGVSGRNGGHALVTVSTQIMGSLKITIKGGNGGNGSNGISGTDGKNGSNGTSKNRDAGHGVSGTSGGSGGHGGQPGYGIQTASFVLDAQVNGTIMSGNSGNGGRGGDGGDGGDGGTGNDGTDLFFNTSGGVGGNGATGGDSGSGGNAYSSIPAISGHPSYTHELIMIVSGNSGLPGQNGVAGSGGVGGFGGNKYPFSGGKDRRNEQGTSGTSGFSGTPGLLLNWE